MYRRTVESRKEEDLNNGDLLRKENATTDNFHHSAIVKIVFEMTEDQMNQTIVKEWMGHDVVEIPIGVQEIVNEKEIDAQVCNSIHFVVFFLSPQAI